ATVCIPSNADDSPEKAMASLSRPVDAKSSGAEVDVFVFPTDPARAATFIYEIRPAANLRFHAAAGLLVDATQGSIDLVSFTASGNWKSRRGNHLTRMTQRCIELRVVNDTTVARRLD